jgi:rod shape-determining protein MreB
MADELDEIAGVDVVSSLPRKAVITSEEVREALSAPLAGIVDAIKLTLDACTPDLAADLVDNGLVLAGGGSLLRLLDRYLSDQTGLLTRLGVELLGRRPRHVHLPEFRSLAFRHAVQRRDVRIDAAASTAPNLYAT